VHGQLVTRPTAKELSNLVPQSHHATADNKGMTKKGLILAFYRESLLHYNRLYDTYIWWRNVYDEPVSTFNTVVSANPKMGKLIQHDRQAWTLEMREQERKVLWSLEWLEPMIWSETVGRFANSYYESYNSRQNLIVLAWSLKIFLKNYYFCGSSRHCDQKIDNMVTWFRWHEFRRSVQSNVSVMWFRRSVHPYLQSSAVAA
jgi:hypothetical protein